MTSKWKGRASLSPGWGAFLGLTGDSRPHAHHALQVAVGFDAPVMIWSAPTGLVALDAVVVPSDVRHALPPRDTVVGLLYIDAESALGRSLQGAKDGIWSAPLSGSPPVRRAFELAAQGDVAGFETLVAMLTPHKAPRVADARVESIVDRLYHSPDLKETSADIAGWASLSPSRFAHRFRQQAGMPLRPYMRWLKLQRAAGAIMAGHSVTEAAYGAGFADAAHLSRTFRRHFGIGPSALSGLAER